MPPAHPEAPLPFALDLPVHGVLPALRQALAEARAAVLTAPPGSGKTTVVPLALLDEPWLGGQGILVSEPRRLAARAAAARMAELLGEPVGETAGYRVRFDQRVSARTRIEVMTEGVLVRRLQGDPGLAGVGLVVLDEFHERSLPGDLALALTLDARAGLREDLRVLVMSATLDAEPVARVLGGAPVIAGEGRPHPVEVRYLERESARPLPERVAEGVRGVLASAAGDVLAFLPGAWEIRAAAERLSDLRAVEVLPLHGDLPAEAQDRALRPAPDGRRRVVLATPIAETSLTLEGVRVVVDSGFARRPRFDPGSGLTRLETVRVSRASAEQRAGRAGRLGPGLCLRLWTAGTQRGLIARTPAEILEADLAPLALELALWGVADPVALAWCDPPPAGALAQGRALLEALGALDRAGRITGLGRRLAGLPFHPRLGRMLLAAAEQGLAEVGCDLAALLSERDLLRGERGRAGTDLADRLAALDAWRSGGAAGARGCGADPVACARVDRVARQARESLGSVGPRRSSGPGAPPVGELLASAYPDRIGQRQPGAPGRLRLAGGRGVRLPETDPLAGCEYLVAAHLDAGSGDGRVFLAAALDRVALARVTGGARTKVEVVDWDPLARAVVAREEDRLGALVLAARPLAVPDPGRLREALIRGLRQGGSGLLPWTPAARELQARVLSLRLWRPREPWPDLSDDALMEALSDWLGPYLTGMTRADHLSRIDLAALLRDRLGWEAVRRLDEAAPTHLAVPSGARRRLVYQPGEPPVLAVKLQELFGLGETPRVCWGEVAVQLHLLSPAGRPLQVTQDLRGFWERTYPEVRKELRGRYPRHPWPEDPWSARPTAGTRR